MVTRVRQHGEARASAPRARAAWPLLALAAVAMGGCGSTASSSTVAPSAQPLAALRLGYLTNLTHAPALIGVAKGFFQAKLPAATTLDTKTFSAGPAESEALLGGSLDAAFVGPNPAINAFTSTRGAGIRVVAGAARGGAGLVVSSGLASGGFPADLKGKTLASPQLGNTQDVALRTWLASKGFSSSVNGGGDVTIDSSSGNAVDLQRFEAHQIAGGWEPEPYLSQYILNGHGTLVVDEASLWPHNQFPTTELVVTTSLLTQHPDIVRDLLKGLIESVDWINHNPADAPTAANAALASISGAKPLSSAVLQMAWTRLHFSVDLLAAALQTDATHAHKAGLIQSTSLKGIIDVKPLNALLSAAGRKSVSDGGLAS